MFGYACISIAKKPKHRQNRPEKYSDSLMQIWFTANTKSRLLYAMILFIYSAKTEDMWTNNRLVIFGPTNFVSPFNFKVTPF